MAPDIYAFTLIALERAARSLVQRNKSILADLGRADAKPIIGDAIELRQRFAMRILVVVNSAKRVKHINGCIDRNLL